MGVSDAKSSESDRKEILGTAMMSRTLQSLVWFIGGIAGTAVIPVVFYLILLVLNRTGASENLMLLPKIVIGLSVYVLAPIGFLLSTFMAFATFRRLGREAKPPLP